jgi:hypothetical protein
VFCGIRCTWLFRLALSLRCAAEAAEEAGSDIALASLLFSLPVFGKFEILSVFPNVSSRISKLYNSNVRPLAW